MGFAFGRFQKISENIRQFDIKTLKGRQMKENSVRSCKIVFQKFRGNTIILLSDIFDCFSELTKISSNHFFCTFSVLNSTKVQSQSTEFLNKNLKIFKSLEVKVFSMNSLYFFVLFERDRV